jgi:hypothetical protein
MAAWLVVRANFRVKCQDLVGINQEYHRKPSVNIFNYWIGILIPESSKYKEGVLTI